MSIYHFVYSIANNIYISLLFYKETAALCFHFHQVDNHIHMSDKIFETKPSLNVHEQTKYETFHTDISKCQQ